ncbi:MAG: 2-dehydro-3-deoxygalactonokinase [Pseudomonadota bacterium]
MGEAAPPGALSAPADWIAVDWGTTRLRAWAMDRGGRAIARRVSDQGMAKLAPSAFEPALLELVAPWLSDADEPVQVLVCGMAGARDGWVEAPYRATPTPPLGNPLTAVRSLDPRLSVRIAPGLSQAAPPDVMRGEETQIAGALAARPEFAGAICLPGTHSKWVAVRNGIVESFRTFLTGELFELLRARSVLRLAMGEGPPCERAFAAGVADALGSPGDILGRLFALRAAVLLEGASGDVGLGRLSGLLIGAEIAGAAPYWRERPVMLVADGAIGALYHGALEQAGVGSVERVESEAATLQGLVLAQALIDGGAR